jgi:uncharacterized protein (DUF4415 family)
MNAKRRKSAHTSSSADEAPEITDSWVAEADLRKGSKLIRRGRPKLDNPKRLLSLRVSPNVIDGWKASGSGWQTRMVKVLERSMPKAKGNAG